MTVTDTGARAIEQREARVRRLIDRAGFQLVKSRARNPLDPTYGTYMIVNGFTNTIDASVGEYGFGLTIDDVEAWAADA